MSSNLNNSSANESTSSIGTASRYSSHVGLSAENKRVFQQVVDLLKPLYPSLESIIPATGLYINPEILLQLEKFEVETRQILPDDDLKTSVDLLRLAESYRTNFGGFQSQVENGSTPATTFEGQEVSLRMRGITIINQLDEVIHQNRELLDQLKHFQRQQGPCGE